VYSRAQLLDEIWGNNVVRRGAHGRRPHPSPAPGPRAHRPQGPSRNRTRSRLLLPTRPSAGRLHPRSPVMLRPAHVLPNYLAQAA
jgi:hypothetical protein